MKITVPRLLRREDANPPSTASTTPGRPTAPRRVRRLVLVALLAFGLGGGAVGTAVASFDDPWVPPDRTIVEIEGDKANGFGIYYYDGTEEFPPTDSEARAECGEYASKVARVRCRTEVRTWYRDLAATQNAIRYARTVAADRVADAAAEAAGQVRREVR
ncbi:hypothetical protein [Nocardioides ferulae]|uniref:hypothetical protein n=1 Tax=Nocardioides ferulae TaxID=2340821 RepID=UPI000EB15CDE|nr:hypothetical protein [Nocardioides ferulae]